MKSYLYNYDTQKLSNHQMSASYIQLMRSLAIAQANADTKVVTEKATKNEERMKQVKEEKFKMLNEKYFDMIPKHLLMNLEKIGLGV